MKKVLIAGLLFASSMAQAESADIAEGQALYEKNCITCHGPKGHGDGPAGKALKAANIFEELEEHKDDEHHILEEVMEGEGAMPAWKGVLSEAQVKNIFAYIKGIQ
jgi:cytochrome c6